MEKLSIQQVSELLQISKDTLRYYDKLGLVCPERGVNNYRSYTAQDVLSLQYIQVLSFTGFTLSEVKQLFGYMMSCDVENLPLIFALLKKKREELTKKVTVFQSMIEYINETEEIMCSKKSETDISMINATAMKMFQQMKELREGQK
ncbi:MAG: MerR family transcriptional regulator [Lachnospiraceae bacterium]|nr:MerR family transcriptional regulator [Lachnospiraceae bacterium]